MLHMVKLICFDRVINLCHTLVVDISGMELGSRSSCKICYYIYIYISKFYYGVYEVPPKVLQPSGWRVPAALLTGVRPLAWS
jgi:hypothetical protein